MEFKDIVMSRYATKKFTEEKVPEDKLNQLLEMIRYSASSLNIQPWKIKIISDDETKLKLFPVSWNQEQITTCSHLLVFCVDTDVDGLLERLEKLSKESGMSDDKIKAYIDMVKGAVQYVTGEQRTAWLQHQLYIALGNALNGAKSLGLDSCPMEGFTAKEYSKILNLPDNLIPTVICPIGYAADEPRPKTRFSKEDVFF
ncbi:NAD(P)H-dependent oxidoreductase [Candidatus Aenigmatarchaeota archaeon]